MSLIASATLLAGAFGAFAAVGTQPPANKAAGASHPPSIQLVSTQPVKVEGRPGSDLSLTTRITIIASQDVALLLLHPDILHAADGPTLIDRSQVQLAAGGLSIKDIKAHTATDLDIKFSGLGVPGTYQGELQFLEVGKGLEASLRFPVTVVVVETPKLAVRTGSTTIKFQAIRCVLGCYLTDWLYANRRLSERPFSLDNASRLPFSLTGSVSAYGDVNHQTTDDSSLSLDIPSPILAKPIIPLKLKIPPDKLPADHYLGDVQLSIPGKDDPLKIPLDFNVKQGPELPICFLVVGILFGRFIKFVQEKSLPQADLFRDWSAVQARVSQDPESTGLLQHILDRARSEIEAMQLDAAKADLALVNARFALLSHLRYLETLLAPRAADPAVQAILDNINKARFEISTDTDPTATAAAIDAAVQALQAPPSSLRSLEISAAQHLSAAATTSHTMTAAPTPKTPWPRRVVSILTGHDDALQLSLNYWFVRPLAWAVLVILLTLVGFLQLYTKNPTFGADLVGDYFGLFIWAAGSDVASRTLSNFKGT